MPNLNIRHSDLERAIIYVATGEKHRTEVVNNVRSSLPFISQYPRFLYTDSLDNIPDGVFTNVLLHPFLFSYRDKIPPLINLPSRFCLFLDDTRVIHDLDPLFLSLGNNHLGGVYAPVRNPPGWSDSTIPSFFPELNSGVLLMRRCTKQRSLIKSWLRLYDNLSRRYNQSWDQASLRSTIWKYHISKKFKFTLFPQEANLRLTKPWVAGRGLPVSIVHGRAPESEFSNLVSYLNDDIDRFRTWTEWLTLYPNTQIRPRHDRTFS